MLADMPYKVRGFLAFLPVILGMYLVKVSSEISREMNFMTYDLRTRIYPGLDEAVARQLFDYSAVRTSVIGLAMSGIVIGSIMIYKQMKLAKDVVIIGIVLLIIANGAAILMDGVIVDWDEGYLFALWLNLIVHILVGCAVVLYFVLSKRVARTLTL